METVSELFILLYFLNSTGRNIKQKVIFISEPSRKREVISILKDSQLSVLVRFLGFHRYHNLLTDYQLNAQSN